MRLALVVVVTRVTNVAKSVRMKVYAQQISGEFWRNCIKHKKGEKTPPTNRSLSPQLNKTHAHKKHHVEQNDFKQLEQ